MNTSIATTTDTTAINDRAPPLPTSLSHCYFTSGSTGTPKGCLLTHANLSSYCSAYSCISIPNEFGYGTAHSIDSSSICLVASSFIFDPSLGDFCMCLSRGSALAMADRADVLSNLFACLQMTKATHITTTPTLFQTVDDNGSGSGDDDDGGLPHLTHVMLGGEKMSQSLAQRWCGRRKLRLFNVYGVTECMGYQMSQLVSRVEARFSLGRSLHDPSEIRLLTTPATGTATTSAQLKLIDDCVDGDEGEIVVVGSQVGVGYLNGPVFADRTYRTGDMACVKDAALVLVGRRDLQVKIGGVRVELTEVEALLQRLFSPILLAAVAVVFHNARLHAFFVMSADGDDCGADGGGGDAACRQHGRFLTSLFYSEMARRQVKSHLMPKRIVFVAGLPQTRTGKTDRQALLALIGEAQGNGERGGAEAVVYDDGGGEGGGEDDGDGEMSELELQIATIWSRVMGVPASAITPSSNFIRLGGDSLVAVRVVTQLSSLLEAKVSIHDNADGDGDGDGGRAKIKETERNEDDHDLTQLLQPLRPTFVLAHPVLRDFALYVSGHFRHDGDRSNGKNGSAAAQQVSGSVHDRPMYYAAANRLNRVCEYLLTQHQQPSAKIPLHLACANGNIRLLQLFLQSGSPEAVAVTARDSRGATLLHSAMHATSVELVRWLIEVLVKQKKLGVVLAATDDDGQAVLHTAARHGAPIAFFSMLHDAEKTLILKKQQPQPQLMVMVVDRWKRTPLHWAALNGHAAVVTELVKNWEGADVAMKMHDRDGETPLDMAERRAKCAAQERQPSQPASVFGAIAKILGGSGTTKAVKAREKKRD